MLIESILLAPAQSAKEGAELVDGSIWRLLRDEVAGGDRPTAHVDSPFSPDAEHVVPPGQGALRGPQHQQGTGNAMPAGAVGLIKIEVAGGTGAVVLTSGVDRGQIHI